MKKNCNTASADLFDIYNSTCLKGLAIIMLIYHHCFMTHDRYQGQEISFILPQYYVNYLAQFFKICVAVFVFISAYGITKKMLKLTATDRRALQISIKNIISSRLIKLLAGFIFVFLLIDLFALFYDPARFTHVYGSEWPEAPAYFILDMLGLAELLQTPSFIGTYWYYSLAIIIVIVCPFMYLLAKKTGVFAFLALTAVFNFTVTFNNRNIWHYVLCIAVGIACAMCNTITKLVQLHFLKNTLYDRILKFILESILIVVLMILRESDLKAPLYPAWDAVIPVILTAFCCEFICKIPVIKDVLLFLGKHSANIFLVHSFIRKTWFYDFTYSFRYPIVVVTVLLCISLILSILIEFLKRGVHFNSFVNRIASSVQVH